MSGAVGMFRRVTPLPTPPTIVPTTTVVAASSQATTIWDILAALGTVGAVVVALVLGFYENRRSANAQRLELERLERERDDARAERDAQVQRERRERLEAQARRIDVWMEDEYRDAEVDDVGHIFTDDVKHVLYLSNYSDMPIRMILAAQRNGDTWDAIAHSLPVVQPGETIRATVVNWREATDYGFAFTDTGGQMWVRSDSGRIYQMGGSEPHEQVVPIGKALRLWTHPGNHVHEPGSTG